MKNYARGKSFHAQTRTFRPKTARGGVVRGSDREGCCGGRPYYHKGGRGCGEQAEHIRAGLLEALSDSFLHENERIFSRRHLQKVRRAKQAFFAANSAQKGLQTGSIELEVEVPTGGEGRSTGGEVAPIATVCQSFFVVFGSFSWAPA